MRTNGVYWQPRSKKELIKCIIDSGHWAGTKTALLAMETKQVRAIFNRIRQSQFISIMKRPTTQETE